VFDPSRTASRSYLPGVKIALAAAHFHSVGVALAGPWDTVEKRPWCPLSPQIGDQMQRVWSVSSPICSRNQFGADFFNSAPWPLPGHPEAMKMDPSPS